MNCDIVIVGAGPAGIFTALELVRKKSRKKILMVEKGNPVQGRRCPNTVTGQCVNCKHYCHITTGFSGAGAFSDGKLSLSCEVGGELPELIGEQLAQKTIEYTDSIYLEFGADTHVEGIGASDKVKQIRSRAIQAGLKLVDCPIRHLGTEKAQGRDPVWVELRRRDAGRGNLPGRPAAKIRRSVSDDGNPCRNHGNRHGPPGRGLAGKTLL